MKLPSYLGFLAGRAFSDSVPWTLRKRKPTVADTAEYHWLGRKSVICTIRRHGRRWRGKGKTAEAALRNALLASKRCHA